MQGERKEGRKNANALCCIGLRLCRGLNRSPLSVPSLCHCSSPEIACCCVITCKKRGRPVESNSHLRSSKLPPNPTQPWRDLGIVPHRVPERVSCDSWVDASWRVLGAFDVRPKGSCVIVMSILGNTPCSPVGLPLPGFPSFCRPCLLLGLLTTVLPACVPFEEQASAAKWPQQLRALVSVDSDRPLCGTLDHAVSNWCPFMHRRERLIVCTQAQERLLRHDGEETSVAFRKNQTVLSLASLKQHCLVSPFRVFSLLILSHSPFRLPICSFFVPLTLPFSSTLLLLYHGQPQH